MSKTQDRMVQKHARTDIPHDRANPRAKCRAIAVGLAFPARGLAVAVSAVRQSSQRIGLQVGARVANRGALSAMHPAIEPDHDQEGLSFSGQTVHWRKWGCAVSYFPGVKHSERKLPPQIRRVLDKHHKGAVAAGVCAGCASTCCNRSGFAILENVILIYGLYRAGKLERSDFRFEPDLSFEEFVYTYFDIWQRPTSRARKDDLLTFHPKCVSANGYLISIPETADYWDARELLFNANPWLSRGCVFLSRMTSSEAMQKDWTTRRCILHGRQSLTHLTSKPLDCVFHTCQSPYQPKMPKSRIIDQWFRALARAYPNSVERFQTRLAGN